MWKDVKWKLHSYKLGTNVLAPNSEMEDDWGEIDLLKDVVVVIEKVYENGDMRTFVVFWGLERVLMSKKE